MAGAGILCQWGDEQHSAVHLLTNIATGTVVGLCEDHFAPGLIPVLAFNLGVDAQHFYAHIEKYIKTQVKAAARELADAQAADAARGLEATHETFHDMDRDLRGERKHADTDDDDDAGPAHPDGIPLDEDEQQERGLFHGLQGEAL